MTLVWALRSPRPTRRRPSSGEPGASPVSARVRILREAKVAGLRTAVAFAPLLPAISDTPQSLAGPVQPGSRGQRGPHLDGCHEPAAEGLAVCAGLLATHGDQTGRALSQTAIRCDLPRPVRGRTEPKSPVRGDPSRCRGSLGLGKDPTRSAGQLLTGPATRTLRIAPTATGRFSAAVPEDFDADRCRKLASMCPPRSTNSGRSTDKALRAA